MKEQVYEVHCAVHSSFAEDCFYCREVRDSIEEVEEELKQDNAQLAENIEQRVLDDRKKSYPDANAGHTNLGLAWTGLIQNHYGIVLKEPLPAELVLLMMAASKANRCAVASREDDYIDLRNYARLAKEARGYGKPKC